MGGGYLNNNKLTSNKKYIVLLLIFLLGILTIYINTSYGLFKKKDFLTDINFIAGTLNYKITSDYLDENNKIVIAKNSDTEINLVLTSLNEIDSKYEIYYNILTDNVDNEDIEVGYTSTSFDSVVGTISSSGTKTVVLKLINNSDKDVEIEIGCEGGLVNNDLILTKGITTNHEISDGDIVLAYNLDGPSELYPESFPGKDDGYTVTGVTCNGADAVWDNENWNVTISNMTGKTINCTVNLENKGYWEFPFINNYKTFVTPVDGTYKIELWGASGGDISPYVGGNGGYTSGNVYFDRGTELFVYVGGSTTGAIGGYNGGGTIQEIQATTGYGRAGGGATDIRLIDGGWSDFNSLMSRIMVAAGGGGANRRQDGYGEGNGGSGGGLIGYTGISIYNTNGYGYGISNGGTQNSGGSFLWNGGSCTIGNNCFTNQCVEYHKGIFGSSASGYGLSGDCIVQTGGGSGYYGGSTGNNNGGGGGSSFISGHNGCDAISEDSTSDNIIHTGQPNHYSGYVFTDTVMIDGDGYNWTTEKGEYVGMPSYVDGSIIAGNDGNGYARITYIGE